MSGAWCDQSFTECVRAITPPAKVKRADSLDAGRFPVVSQEAELVNGYWDNESDVIKADRPIVVFGDHTRVVKFVDFDFVAGADGTKVLATRDGIDPRYFYYFLLAHPVGGLGYARHFKLLKELRVRFPKDLAEQKRIVAILDEAFEAIERAEIAYNSIPDCVDSSMSRFFAQLVPTKGHSSWTPTTIADVAVQRKGAIRTGPFGSQLLHSEFVDDGVRVLGIDNAVHNEFAWDQIRCITDAKYEGLQRYTVHPGDVIITIMGTCGRCAVIPSDMPLSITSKHLCCITLDQQLCLPEFLKLFFLKHPMARQHLASQTKGAIMDGLNMTIIKSVPLMLPSIEEQREIVDQLSTFQNACTDLSRIATERQDKCDELRSGLLSAAFRGELEQSTSHVASFVGAAS